MALRQGLVKKFTNLFARKNISAATINREALGEPCDSQEWLSGLSDVQKVLLKLHAPPRLFVVVSWGCAATNWIAHAINSHPDVLCLHQGNDKLQGFGWPGLDGLDYLRIVMMLGLGYKAAGDVHGVARHHVPHLKRVFGDRIRASVVVREPMHRLSSQVAAFRQFRDVRNGFWNIDYVDSLIEQHDLRLPGSDFDHKSFVHAVNLLNAILEERAVGTIYRCEDLTVDPVVLRGFMEEMTDGQVEITGAWLSRELGRKRMNVHGGSSHRQPWSAWQLEVIRKVVRPQAWALYEELGYKRPDFVG